VAFWTAAPWQAFMQPILLQPHCMCRTLCEVTRPAPLRGQAAAWLNGVGLWVQGVGSGSGHGTMPVPCIAPCSRAAWGHMGPHGAAKTHMGPHGATWLHMESVGVTCVNMGQLGPYGATCTLVGSSLHAYPRPAGWVPPHHHHACHGMLRCLVLSACAVAPAVLCADDGRCRVWRHRARVRPAGPCLRNAGGRPEAAARPGPRPGGYGHRPAVGCWAGPLVLQGRAHVQLGRS
jgi:hypothetical protein